MGTITYNITKKDLSSYCLTVTKERVLLNNEVFTSVFRVPFLDFLLSLRETNIYNLLLDCITMNLELSKLHVNKEMYNFFSLFTFFLNKISNKNPNDIEFENFSRILRNNKDEYVKIQFKYDWDFKQKIENLQKDFEFHKLLSPTENLATTKSNLDKYWRTRFEEQYDNVFKDYILTLIREPESVSLTKPEITDPKILQLLSGPLVKKVENELIDYFVQEIEIILKDFYYRFEAEKSNFYNDCLIRLQEKQIKKQTLQTPQNITDKDQKRISKILEKNPSLNNPNLIMNFGENLIYHLIRKLSLSIYNDKNIKHKYSSDSKTFGLLYNNKNEPIVFSGLKPNFDLNHQHCFKPDHCFLKNNYYSVGEFYININTPIVKQVNLLHSVNEGSSNEIVYELRNKCNGNDSELKDDFFFMLLMSAINS